jgi:HPt (histidine-containing phosphotransfer) domain-containing protein
MEVWFGMEPVRTIDDLEKRGFDVEEGIAMCAGDEEIYLEVLEAALEEGKEKLPLIKECYEQKNLDRYCIEMHGLKNAMKSIGAGFLSEAAKEQELAVKENNLRVVDEGVENVLAQYRDVIDALEELFANCE